MCAQMGPTGTSCCCSSSAGAGEEAPQVEQTRRLYILNTLLLCPGELDQFSFVWRSVINGLVAEGLRFPTRMQIMALVHPTNEVCPEPAVNLMDFQNNLDGMNFLVCFLVSMMYDAMAN